MIRLRLFLKPPAAAVVVCLAVVASFGRAQAPPDSAGAIEHEVNRKLIEHDLSGARAAAEKAPAKDPEAPGLWVSIGRAAYLRGEFGDAEMDFKKALRMDAKSGAAWAGLGMVFEAASQKAKAKVCYKTAWQDSPSDPDAQRGYARTVPRVDRLRNLQAWMDGPEPGRDPSALESVRKEIEQMKAAGEGPLFELASPLAHTEIKLSPLLFTANRLRGAALPVSFNGGRTLHLLLDSGASGIVLNRKSAEAAGLTRMADVKFHGIGDEGERAGYTAMADEVRIGGAAFRHCPIAVSERKFLTDEDGLVGTNVFSAFLVTIDVRKMVVQLDPLPPLKAKAAEAEWPEDAWVDREVAPELAKFTPFWHVGHEILLSTRVNGSKPVLFLLDSGSSTSLIDPEYAKQFTGVRSEDLVRLKGVSGSVSKMSSAENLTFEFAGYRQPIRGILAAPLGRLNRDSPAVTGIFGYDNLYFFRTRIDYRDGLIELEYTGPKY